MFKHNNHDRNAKVIILLKKDSKIMLKNIIKIQFNINVSWIMTYKHLKNIQKLKNQIHFIRLL